MSTMSGLSGLCVLLLTILIWRDIRQYRQTVAPVHFVLTVVFFVLATRNLYELFAQKTKTFSDIAERVVVCIVNGIFVFLFYRIIVNPHSPDQEKKDKITNKFNDPNYEPDYYIRTIYDLHGLYLALIMMFAS